MYWRGVPSFLQYNQKWRRNAYYCSARKKIATFYKEDLNIISCYQAKRNPTFAKIYNELECDEAAEEYILEKIDNAEYWIQHKFYNETSLKQEIEYKSYIYILLLILNIITYTGLTTELLK